MDILGREIVGIKALYQSALSSISLLETPEAFVCTTHLSNNNVSFYDIFLIIALNY